MQARPVRSAWCLQKTSVPTANSSRIDGMIKSSFFIGRTSSSNILSQVGTQKISRWDAIPGRAHASPMIEKPAQAGFSGLLPLAATLPMGGCCQGPASAHTGWLCGRYVSVSTGLDCGRPAEYVPRKGSKSSKTSPVYRSALTCGAVHIPRPNLWRDRVFNAAADLLRHVLNLTESLPPILRFKAVIKCCQI